METNVIYNEDCYKGIKKIPDKSIDLVYIDIPYLYNQGGAGNSVLGESAAKKRLELMGYNEDFIKKYKSNAEALKAAKKENANSNTNLENGIDYSILDELCRVMKNIYIYMVQ